MPIRKLSSFSPCGEYFVSCNDSGVLTIWDIATNNIKQQCNIHSEINSNCSSLIWGSQENNIFDSVECSGNQYLIIGTEKGSIYLYDYSNGQVQVTFRSRHANTVNDLCLNTETNQLFSCSINSIINWDIASGVLLSQFNISEELYSICVVDSDNLLTGGTSICWWNIAEWSMIKKFCCFETPVHFLSVVTSLQNSTTYFLSAAYGETKINAWSLNKKSKSAVASFTLPDEIHSIDVNKFFSEDNPLFLTAVTKSGKLALFQHVLNGTTKNLTPLMTLSVMAKPHKSVSGFNYIPVISSKILEHAESCIIAYGSNEHIVFESVNIFECPKTMTLTRENPLGPEVAQDRIVKKREITVINGQNSVPTSCHSSPKRLKQKEKNKDSPNSIQSEEYDSNIQDSRTTKASPNVKKRLKLSKKLQKESTASESDLEEVIVDKNPSEMAKILIRGVEEERTHLANSVLHCENDELIRSIVRSLPQSSLNLILLELHKRLISKDYRYHSSLIKWLKETLDVHLPYLITRNDLTQIINEIKDYVDRRKPSETLLKLNMLRGLLRVQIQNISLDGGGESSCSESDSENELMES